MKNKFLTIKNHHPHHKTFTATFTASLLLIASCGGGGSSNPNPGASHSPTPTAPSYSILAQASPSLHGLVACIDKNESLTCDEAELSATISNDGSLSIPSPSAASYGDLILVNAPGVMAMAVISNPDSPTTLNGLSTLAASTYLKTRNISSSTNTYTSLMRLQTQAQINDWNSNSLLAGSPAHATDSIILQTFNLAYNPGQTEATESRISSNAKIASNIGQFLNRYISLTERGSLIPTVSQKTAISEVRRDTYGTACITPTEIPTLHLNTQNNTPIVDKVNEIPATISFTGSSIHSDTTSFSAVVKGRGNMTWSANKKPFKIKLDKKASILNMPSNNKHWVLMSNPFDPTLMRNKAAFCAAQELGADWVPSMRPVNLHINGTYNGLYDIGEHVRDDAERVDIGKRIGTLTEPHPDDGFFIEMDWRLGEEFFFYTPAGLAYTVKNDSSPADRDRIFAYMNNFEERLYDRQNPQWLANISEVLDIESFLDYYIVQEMTKNNDAYSLSTFLYRKTGGKLAFNPPWDFDLSSGFWGDQDPTGWKHPNSPPIFNNTVNSYVGEMLEHQVIKDHLLRRMRYFNSRIPHISNFIQANGQLLAPDRQADLLLWNNPEDGLDYNGSIAKLNTWYVQRSAWMLSQMEAGVFR